MSQPPLENTVQTGSKHDVTVRTASVCFPWASSCLMIQVVFLSAPPLSTVLSDAMGVEVFFLALTASDSGAGPRFCAALPPSLLFSSALHILTNIKFLEPQFFFHRLAQVVGPVHGSPCGVWWTVTMGR